MSRLGHIILLLLMLFCIGSDVVAQKKDKKTTENDRVILLLDLNSGDAALDSLLRSAGVEKPDIRSIKAGNYQELKQQGWNVVVLPGNHLRIDRLAINMIATGKGFLTADELAKSANPGYPGEVMFGVNNFARVTVHELPNGMTRFFVPGRKDAKRVMLSGNFNSWSTLKGVMLKTDSGWIRDVRLEPGIYHYKFIFDGHWKIDQNNKQKATDLVMRPVADGWELKLYLHEGMHLYHFLVDGQPVTDPDNKLTNNDASGNKNSVVNLGQTMVFRLAGYENARHVYLTGSFNNWKPDELAMEKTGDTWVLPYTLPAGNYEYKFIVDGHWITDPTNQQTARENGQTNSFISVSPNHTFILKGYGSASSVRLSGTFNNWDKAGYTMQRKGDDWVISLRLKQGKYLYKFIINNDNWIRDPGNPLWEQNQEITGNSVLWID